MQTFTPFNAAVQAARRLDYEGFSDQELAFRKELGYPPFKKLACMTFKGLNEAQVVQTAKRFETMLRPLITNDTGLCEAVPAPIARAKGYYRYQMIMRATTSRKLSAPIKLCLQHFKWPKEVKYAIDIDAYSLM